MYIDRILAPIETLGPGNRLVIWVKGCTKRCKGCANPELWDTSTASFRSVEDIMRIVCNVYEVSPFEGITISGGDPLEQQEDLLRLLKRLNEITDDILVYTGYTCEEVQELWTQEAWEELTGSIAVLIDGPYMEELNTEDVVLRGSGNQRIVIFKEKYRERYETYLSEGRKVQNVHMGKRMISVGIHNRKENQS